jgi:hypothetical protein
VVTGEAVAVGGSKGKRVGVLVAVQVNGTR